MKTMSGNRVPSDTRETGLDIDYGYATRRARQEQAIAVREAILWLDTKISQGLHAFGERLERAVFGATDDVLRMP